MNLKNFEGNLFFTLRSDAAYPATHFSRLIPRPSAPKRIF